jgi:hypothetical protein
MSLKSKRVRAATGRLSLSCLNREMQDETAFRVTQYKPDRRMDEYFIKTLK